MPVPFVANTDRGWFDDLRRQADDRGRLDDA
jgi:hypothetical protein